MVDCLPSLCGDYGNYRVATSLHGCGRTDILFAKIVRDHGDSDDCTGAVGTSVAADYRTGIGIVDWDSVKLAPIERDAWFYICNSNQLSIINDVIQKYKLGYMLKQERLCYYCYYSFFTISQSI